MNYREAGAAKYLTVTRSYLRKRRRLRLDPSYARVDRMIIYRQSDLDDFLEKHLRQPDVKSQAVGEGQKQ